MKKRILSIVALAALVALPMSVFAAEEISNTEQSTASAKIVTPLMFNKDGSGQKGNLVFGAIAQGDVASDVKVDDTQAASAEVVSGTAVILNATTFPSNSAHFTFKGQAGYNYTITSAFPTLLANTASENVEIKLWETSIPTTTPQTFTGLTQDLYVGATIVVPPTTTTITSPDFQANFSVTIAYN